MTTERCSGAGGRPYPGDHTLGEHAFFVIEPSGAFKRFCDSDCLREHYAHLLAQMAEALVRELQEGA